MQWDTTHNSGFSIKSEKESKMPWMRVHDDYPDWNVELQVGKEGSVLEFWKKMLKFRKRYLACVSLQILYILGTQDILLSSGVFWSRGIRILCKCWELGTSHLCTGGERGRKGRVSELKVFSRTWMMYLIGESMRYNILGKMRYFGW